MMQQYFDRFSYRLEVENSSLSMQYVPQDAQQSSLTFGRNEFELFLNTYNNPNNTFVIRNVQNKYNSTYFENDKIFEHKPWSDSLDNYIKLYKNSIDVFGNSYLAISPDGTTKLIVRNNELVFFAKYFENWSFDLIVTSTTPEHLKQWNLFNNVIGSKFGFSLNIGQLIAVTLICNLIDNNQDRLLPEALEMIVDDYQSNGIFEEFQEIKRYSVNWINFCNLLHYKHYPKDIINTDLDKLLSNIFRFSILYYDFQFFHDYHKSYDNQLMFIKTLPFNRPKRQLMSLN